MWGVNKKIRIDKNSGAGYYPPQGGIMAKRKKTKLAERKLTMTFSIDGDTWAALDAVRNGRTRSYCIMEALGAWLKKEGGK